jgi:hypothetical protein
MSPTAKLSEVMSRPVEVAMADQKLAEIDALFATQSGLPVLDGEGRCIGVVSKKDKAKASNGASASVSILFFCMSPITCNCNYPSNRMRTIQVYAFDNDRSACFVSSVKNAGCRIQLYGSPTVRFRVSLVDFSVYVACSSIKCSSPLSWFPKYSRVTLD